MKSNRITNAKLFHTLLVCISLLTGSDLFSQNHKHIPPVSFKKERKWKLVWADEFNKNGKPDPANWEFEQGFARNEELQWYQEDNAICKNGVLVIEGRKEQIRNPNYDPASNDWRKNREYAQYTASSMVTEGLRQFQFGRFEIRAKIDTAMGLWPAIWTLGISGEWPSSGEIDLMESYPINNEHHILANVAWGTNKRYSAKWDSQKVPLSHFLKKDSEWPHKFHIWRMDWDENCD